MAKLTVLNFPNFDMAWEGVQEFLANNEDEIKEKGLGGTYATEMVIYNLIMNVERATVNQNFNFGKALGYTNKKWTKLVGNYINFDYLELVKSEIMAREKKKQSSYNIVVRFDNSHNSGKDCLIALQFQKRLDDPYPTAIFTTRASECTKRMLFDFLLVQRMIEYVYGKSQVVHAMMILPFVYINIESFLMYCGLKGGPDKILIPNDDGKLSNFQKKVKARYHEFMTKHPDEIKYKVHRRAAVQIQGFNPAKDVWARDLVLVAPLKITPSNLEKLNRGL